MESDIEDVAELSALAGLTVEQAFVFKNKFE